MKTKILVCLSSMFVSSLAWAGPSTGGGGFGVFCGPTPISSASVELLDLYEGEQRGYTMVQTTGDLKQDYFESVKRTYTIQGIPELAEEQRSEIQTNLLRFMQSVKFVKSVQDLPVAKDLGAVPWVPTQCSIQQIAYFDDASTTIYVLRSAWDQIGLVGQSALVSHELISNDARRNGALTSSYARLAVAHMYAATGPTPLLFGVPQGSTLFYASPLSSRGAYTAFYSFALPASNVRRLQFYSIGGRAMLTQTWAYIPLIPGDFAFGASASQPEITGCILQTKGVDTQVSALIQGSMTPNYRVTYKLKTGEPIKLTFEDNDGIFEEESVDGGSNCSGL